MPDLAEIDSQMASVIMSAWSDNTWSTRQSQWKRYFRFCMDTELIPLPADVLTIARFLIHLGQSSQFSTVTNYLSAINNLHRYYAYDIDYRAYYIIKFILAGLKRILGGLSVPKDPLTPLQLKMMYLCSGTTVKDELCWLSLIFSFRTLLRKSNFLPDGSKTDCHLIRRQDIEFHQNYLIVNVRSTKTLLKGEKVLQIPIFHVADYTFDVYSRLLHHIRSVPAEGTSFLFLKQTKSGLEPLMYKEVLTYIKSLVKAINLDPDNIGLHSLRRSRASFLHCIGIPLEDIRMAGDWRSMAVLLYLVNPFSKKMELESKIASALCDTTY